MPKTVGQSSAERMQRLAALWGRVQEFCEERGWHAFLYVREDPEQFGRVGVKVEQAGGYSFQAWGFTSDEAIGRIVRELEREGFNG